MSYYRDIITEIIPNEVWENLKDYEGLYQISSLGRIKSLNKIVKRKKQGNFYQQGRILRQREEQYLKIGLSDVTGSFSSKKMHRLVATTFLVFVPGKNHVNHKDGDKYNNCVENLEWCTHEENMRHAYENNLIPKASGEKHYKSKWVLDLQTGVFYETGKEASIAKGYDYGWLGNRLCGQCKNKTMLIYV
jgi:hypothetical protein